MAYCTNVNDGTKGETPFVVALAHQAWKHIWVFLAPNMAVPLKNKAGKSALDIAREYRDGPDLTEKIPMLLLSGKEGAQKIRDSYKKCRRHP